MEEKFSNQKNTRILVIEDSKEGIEFTVEGPDLDEGIVIPWHTLPRLQAFVGSLKEVRDGNEVHQDQG